jgi:hypothetical protein
VLGQLQNTRPKNTAEVRTVLPTIGMLPRTGKYLTPIATQSSTAVIHCIVTAPQFSSTEGCSGSQTWSSHMRDSDLNHSATTILLLFIITTLTLLEMHITNP